MAYAQLTLTDKVGMAALFSGAKTRDSANYQRWLRDGGHDAAERAGERARTTIEGYERPPLDAGRLAELEEYVVRRRAELGD